MANGAGRLFNVIKNTSEGTNLNPSQVVSLTVKSINPIIFRKDDKLDITEDFCVYNKTFDKTNLSIGDIITAFALNDGQVYFIQQNETRTYIGNYNLLDNLPKINGVELKNNKSNYDLKINDYSEEETIIGRWINGKPLYIKVIVKNITTTDFISFNHNIEDIDSCWLSGDSFLDVDGTSLPLNYHRYNTDNNIYAHVSCDNIYIKVTPTRWINNNAYFIIKYTKTTDDFE